MEEESIVCLMKWKWTPFFKSSCPLSRGFSTSFKGKQELVLFAFVLVGKH